MDRSLRPLVVAGVAYIATLLVLYLTTDVGSLAALVGSVVGITVAGLIFVWLGRARSRK